MSRKKKKVRGRVKKEEVKEQETEEVGWKR